MYIYVKENTGEFITMAYRGKGRVAANHKEINCDDFRLFVGVVKDGVTATAVEDLRKNLCDIEADWYGSPGVLSGRDDGSVAADAACVWTENLYSTTVNGLCAAATDNGITTKSSEMETENLYGEDASHEPHEVILGRAFSIWLPTFNALNKALKDGKAEGRRLREEAAAPVAEPVAAAAPVAPAETAAESSPGENSGVFWPEPDATYVLKPQIDNLLGILEKAATKCPQNVNLVGPHGCGKTELAIQFAARTKRPMLIMDCANLREARDWFGYKTAKDGTVYWHESQFVRALEAGNHVILLDEINRANSSLLNTLMPLLDGRRFTYLEEKGARVVVGPGTVFFATMNEGAGYTGTSALDRAVRDRFPRSVELSYLDEKDEIQLLVKRTSVDKTIARRLVQMANKVRQDAVGLSAALTESISTRQLIAAAHDYVLGGVETLEFTITNHFSTDGDADSERVKVQSIIQGKFGDIMAAAATKAEAEVKADTPETVSAE